MQGIANIVSEELGSFLDAPSEDRSLDTEIESRIGDRIDLENIRHQYDLRIERARTPEEKEHLRKQKEEALAQIQRTRTAHNKIRSELEFRWGMI